MLKRSLWYQKKLHLLRLRFHLQSDIFSYSSVFFGGGVGFVPPAPSQSLKMCVFWKSNFNLTLKCRNTIIVLSQVLWEQCSIGIGWSRQSHAFCLWWYDNSLNTTRGQPIKRSSPLHTYWCRPTQIVWLQTDWLMCHQRSSIICKPSLICLRAIGISPNQTRIVWMVAVIFLSQCNWAIKHCATGQGRRTFQSTR